ncbi:MAG: alkaline phosphatase family protein [Cytophagaceae bacterium]|nr:alkaline phosphatase family protein [Cytophagaceae bacterium]
MNFRTSVPRLCLFFHFSFFIVHFSFSQTPRPLPAKPKLIVGIVVDQMRYDFLYRYADQYGAGGFQRMLDGGFNAKNTQYSYFPTVTAAGHSSIYTGSVPAVNGIVGNEWFDQGLGRSVYCTEDSTARATGGNPSKAGWMSPRNLSVSTITDQLRLSTNFRSKVVGVALKDRGSILPAGHTGTAYWFDGRNGDWISSTYYMADLPQWVKDFNARKLPAQYVSAGWKPLLPLEQYTQSTADDVPWEAKLTGDTKPVFPHELASPVGGERFGLISVTPFGNTMTKEIALAAIRNEQLGKGADTDFLAVSFSSTDYAGHAFGPNSVEVQDVYLRLDRDLAEMLTFLDGWVGKDNYLVFLTADHGVVDVPEFAQSKKLPGGRYNLSKALTDVEVALKAAFGEGDFIEATTNYQLHLNDALLKEKKLTVNQIYDVVKTTLLPQPGIAAIVNLHELGNAPIESSQVERLRNGYHPKRSGDIFIGMAPGWLSGSGYSTGTSHSTFYKYDTHVPCVWYGWKVPVGFTVAPTNVSDIAPTLASMLDILEPSGSVGEPIRPLVEGLRK